MTNFFILNYPKILVPSHIMTIQYGLSTYGKNILVHESPEEFTNIRAFFVFVSLSLGSTLILTTIQDYRKLMSKQHQLFPYSTPKSLFLIDATHLFFVLAVFGHMVHFVDHNYRAVTYHEPKYVHQKYVVSTMEFSFLLDLMYFGIRFMAIRGFLDVDRKGVVVYKWVYAPSSPFFPPFIHMFSYALEGLVYSEFLESSRFSNKNFWFIF